MASIPVKHTPGAEPTDTVEKRFRQLQADWEKETAYLSSYSDIVAHPAFREIVRMGDLVVPLMLRDLEERPRLWVWALPEITGVNPVPPADAGKIAKMSEAWLNWGKARGYQW
jgi:hypothetical protein